MDANRRKRRPAHRTPRLHLSRNATSAKSLSRFRMVATTPIQVQAIWELLKDVNDPEVPVLSITDLGIVRNVEISDDEVIITVTPTYTGCPAVDAINMNIRLKLMEHGYKKVKI